MMRFFFPLFPTLSLSLSVSLTLVHPDAHALYYLYPLFLSLSLFSPRRRKTRTEDRYAHASLSVCFFLCGRRKSSKRPKAQKILFVCFLYEREIYERDERRMREISSRGGMSAKNLYFIPLLLSTNHHETIKQKKFAEGARESQSPAQNARHFIPRNSFSLFISSHLTFDDDYDDDDEQQQQQRISFQSSLCIDQ